MRTSFFFIHFILFFILSLNGFCQKAEIPQLYKDGISVNIHGGFFIPHRDHLKFLQKDHAKGISIHKEWRTLGSTKWQHDYQFPLFGLDLYLMDLGNDEDLGQQASVNAYVKLPLHYYDKKVRHYIHLGSGLGYTNRVWDFDEHIRAVTLSSRINASIVIGYDAEFKIKDNLDLTAGLRLSHLSNAAYKLPNLGTNVISIYTGIKLNYNKREIMGYDLNSISDKPPALYEFTGSFGIKEIDFLSGRKYPTLTFRANRIFRLSDKSDLSLGLDLFYNSTLYHLVEDDSKGKFVNNFQNGLVGGYHLKVGNLVMTLQQGLYLYNRYKTLGITYTRLGFKYKLNDTFFLGSYLKSHYARADHFEISLGFEL